MSNVVSLKDHKMNKPKEAVLEFRNAGRTVVIRSPDYRTTFLNETYDQPPSEAEFDALVSYWKAKHPDCLCIDF